MISEEKLLEELREHQKNITGDTPSEVAARALLQIFIDKVNSMEAVESKEQQHWREEAIKQTTAAGELRKEFEILLDDLRKSIHTVRHQMDSETDQDTKVRLHVKLMTLRQQADRIDEILNRPPVHKISADYDSAPEWQQAVMKHFTRVE